MADLPDADFPSGRPRTPEAEDFDALVESNLDGFLMIDEAGTLVEANATYLRMSGYTLEELRRLRMNDLDAVETRAETEQRTELIRARGWDRFQSFHRRKDGTAYPVEVSTRFLPGRRRAIGIIRDLSERAEAERALRDSEAQHRELLELLAEGVAMADLDEVFLYANPQAEQIFGVPRGRLVGECLRAFLDGSEVDKVAEQTALRREGHTNAYQLTIRRPDGQRRILQLTATPRRDSQGGVTGSLAVFRDITEELQTQQALRLAQKMEGIGNLASGMAHDMNNVLGAILGLATTHLDSQPPGTPLHAALDTIARACLRGRSTVKGLLDFARRDAAGRLPLSLNTLIREEAALLERTIPAKVRLTLDLDPDLGQVLGDKDALSLTVMNLCVNALDAMPDGGDLILRTRRDPGGWALVTVTDTGCGMAPDILEHAFEPFFTTKPQGKGTGLGLSMAYSTLKSHGGFLEVESALDQGTRITLRLPESAPAPLPAPAPAPAAPTPAAARQVLVVDDDDLLRSAVLAQLEALGHATAAARSGEEAMALVDGGLRPDLVILDLNMPGWGGEQTLPRLRTALPQTPILLSTGRPDPHAQALAAAHPGVALLPKPYGLRDLRAAFERMP